MVKPITTDQQRRIIYLQNFSFTKYGSSARSGRISRRMLILLGILLLVFAAIVAIPWAIKSKKGEVNTARSPLAEPSNTASVVCLEVDGYGNTHVITYPFQYAGEVTSEQYAAALAALPQMEYTNYGDHFHYRDPKATLKGQELQVNYTDVLEESSLSSSEMISFLTTFDSWYFVPGVAAVRWLREGKSVDTFAEMGLFTQPLVKKGGYSYYCNVRTGEIMRVDNDRKIANPQTIAEMTTLLNKRSTFQLHEGYEPLLPEGTLLRTPLYPKIHPKKYGGIQIDLPSSFPVKQSVRLAGIALSYLQYKDIEAVTFTFDGKRRTDRFMRTTLNKPIHSYDLLLPFPPGSEQVIGDLPWFEDGYTVSSPSGRYLAIYGRNLNNGKGIFIFDIKNAGWRKLDGSEGNVKMSWLPDESAIITSYGRKGPEYSIMFSDNDLPWRKYQLDGKVEEVTDLPPRIDWALIPDGSGIIATVREKDRCRVKAFSFSKKAWRDVFLSRLIPVEGGTGDNLAFRQKGKDWILSYHESGPSDCRSYWVNLTTGKSAIGDEGDPLFNYSPDGQYVITYNGTHGDFFDSVLFRARNWPYLQARDYGTVTVDKPIVRFTYKMGDQTDNYFSPDSRHVLSADTNHQDTGPRNGAYRIYETKTGKLILNEKANPGNIRVIGWAGPNALLLAEENKGKDYRFETISIKPLEGEPEEIYRVIMD